MNRITTYQAKYLANYLTRRLPANDINKLTASLQDAQVDLTPHQVEAALRILIGRLPGASAPLLIAVERSETDEECGRKSYVLCSVSGFFRS